MAKRKAATRASTRRPAKKRAPVRADKRASGTRSAKAPATARTARSGKSGRKKAVVRAATPRRAAKAAPVRRKAPAPKPGKAPNLDRVRRTLNEPHGVPSSLDLDQRGSAASTGQAEMAEKLREHGGMTDVAAGDVDVDVEDAYFTGEEAPGGDNPTPDQDIVDDIGKALGVVYDDNEPLKGSDKLVERDKHRWELDPASAEDYKDRKK
jgi:uncharacterized protein DUF6335